MQRSTFDVGSIAALLRQTEANLSSISRPRREEPAPFLSHETRQAWTSTPPLAEPTPIAAVPVTRGPVGVVGIGNGLELEAQVIHLRSCVESLERRLEDELRAFLGVCEKRLQAKEEQLRGVGDTLQVTADNAVEALTRRVDARLRELERAASERGDRSLEEVWETLRRLQADGRALESRLQRCALGDDLAERVREVDRSLQQRLEEKTQAHEKRAVEYRSQLESSTESWRETMAQRCAALEQKVWEQLTDRADLADAVLKKLPEMAPLRELQEELKSQAYNTEVQQRRLTTCEAKLSKLSALDAKLEFVETHTAHQVAEQAQETRGLGDVAQKLSQKMAAMETTFQRIESQGSNVEARLHARIEEDRSQAAVGLEALQQRLLQRVDDVEAHLQRSSTRVEREVAQQVAALALRTSEDGASFQRQVEGRFREFEARADSRAAAAVQQLDRVGEELRREAQVAAEALQQHSEAQLSEHRGATQLFMHKAEQSLSDANTVAQAAQQDAARMAQEAVSVAFKDVEQQSDRLSAELHASLESLRGQIETRHTGLEGSLSVLEEQHRAHAAAQEADSGAVRTRLEALDGRVAEAHVGAVRAQTTADSLKASVANLEGTRAGLATVESSIHLIEEQIRSRVQEWTAEIDASKSRADVAQARVTDLAGAVQHLQSGVESLRVGAAGAEARGEHMRVTVSSLEVQVQSIQRRIDALRTVGAESGTGAPTVAQQLEADEVRSLGRSVGDLRLEFGELRARLAAGGPAGAGPADGRVLGLQDAVGELRGELAAVRGEAQGAAARAARQEGQLAAAQAALESLQESVASLQRIQRAQPPPLLIPSGASSLDRSSPESRREPESGGATARQDAAGAGAAARGDPFAPRAAEAAQAGAAGAAGPGAVGGGGPLGAGGFASLHSSVGLGSPPRASEASLDSARGRAAEAEMMVQPRAEQREPEVSIISVEQPSVQVPERSEQPRFFEEFSGTAALVQDVTALSEEALSLPAGLPDEPAQPAGVEQSMAAVSPEHVSAESMGASSGAVLPIESMGELSPEPVFAAGALTEAQRGAVEELSGVGLHEEASREEPSAAAEPPESPQAVAAVQPQADDTLETLGLQSLGSFMAGDEQSQRRTEQEIHSDSAVVPEVAVASREAEAQQQTRPVRQRGVGLPLVARASKRSKEAEMRKAFDDMDARSSNELSLEDLRAYLADYLGFGIAEVMEYFQRYGPGESSGCMPFESFCSGYATLNPYQIMERKNEVIIRKPGSLGGQQLNLDGLEDCEVYACDSTAQVFVDCCKRSIALLGPCESSVFVRDCDDCVFWIAAMQLRTYNCHRCTFHLYSKTEPLIEASEDLAFAPWSARFPGCTAQFERRNFDAGANLWNAICDFTGKLDRSNWRILPLEEVVELVVELQEPAALAAPPDSPGTAVTHEALCAEPLSSGESCGESIANLPQCRPDPPPPPPSGFQGIRTHMVRDEWQRRTMGAQTVSTRSELPRSAPAVAAEGETVPADLSELGMSEVAGLTRSRLQDTAEDASNLGGPEAQGSGAPDVDDVAQHSLDPDIPEISRIAASDGEVTAGGMTALDMPEAASAIAGSADLAALSVSGLDVPEAPRPTAGGTPDPDMPRAASVVAGSADLAALSVSGLDVPEAPRSPDPDMPRVESVVAGSADLAALSVSGLELPEAPRASASDADFMQPSTSELPRADAPSASLSHLDAATPSVSGLDVQRAPRASASELDAATGGVSEIDIHEASVAAPAGGAGAAAAAATDSLPGTEDGERHAGALGPDLGLSSPGAASEGGSWDDSDGDDVGGLRHFPGLDDEEDDQGGATAGEAAPAGNDEAAPAPESPVPAAEEAAAHGVSDDPGSDVEAGQSGIAGAHVHHGDVNSEAAPSDERPGDSAIDGSIHRAEATEDLEHRTPSEGEESLPPGAGQTGGAHEIDRGEPGGASEEADDNVSSDIDADELLAGLEDQRGPVSQGDEEHQPPLAAEEHIPTEEAQDAGPSTATIHGDMGGGDDDNDDSDDGLPLRAADHMRQAPSPPESDDSGGHEASASASASASAPASRAAVRAMLGEDSSEGEEEAAPPTPAGRSTASPAAATSRPWQRPQLSTRAALAGHEDSDDDDEDEIERAAGAMRSSPSAASLSRGPGRSSLGSRSGILGTSGQSVGTPGSGRAGAALGERAAEPGLQSASAEADRVRSPADGSSTAAGLGGEVGGALRELAAEAGMEPAARGSGEAASQEGSEGGNSWDGSSMASHSPRAMAALGLNSPGGSGSEGRSRRVEEAPPDAAEAPPDAAEAPPGAAEASPGAAEAPPAAPAGPPAPEDVESGGGEDSDEFGDDDDIPL